MELTLKISNLVEADAEQIFLKLEQMWSHKIEVLSN